MILDHVGQASELPYTIVRPGWFDYNAPDQHRLHLLQGDTRHAGNPSDGVVSRRQIAEVLVASLTSDQASRKTFELVAETGPAPDDLAGLFEPLQADPPDVLDGVRDAPNMPPHEEPQRVRADLENTLRLFDSRSVLEEEFTNASRSSIAVSAPPEAAAVSPSPTSALIKQLA